jgi:hypothetical protein
MSPPVCGLCGDPVPPEAFCRGLGNFLCKRCLDERMSWVTLGHLLPVSVNARRRAVVTAPDLPPRHAALCRLVSEWQRCTRAVESPGGRTPAALQQWRNAVGALLDIAVEDA